MDYNNLDFLQTYKLKRLPKYLYYFCRDTKNTLVELKLGEYWILAAIRVLLTLTPQTGYIHPDEYFQTVEVFAGNVFSTEVSLPWEFNNSFPIRSIPVIYSTIHVPLALLKKASALTEIYLGLNLINHYSLLVVPRLSMCLLSFISDVCLFRICYYFGQNFRERLVFYGSSFVCLVFMTRTFTNTVEITCFNILLCLVASCMAESEKVLYQNDFLKDKFNEASTTPDRVRILKLMKLLPKHSLNQCIPIAFVTVAGFFNRPTFVLYAVTPLFFWFQRGLDVRSSFLADFHVRIFIFLIYCFPIICIFIYFDSAYYGYITWSEIFNLKISWDNFVVTPLNFVKYNIDSSNLSKHGLHPRFLHVLVNIPLLFNVLGLSGLIVIVKLLYRGSLSNWTLLPKSQSITSMMTLSFIVPVLGLSLFPHQEPRFIIPILLPLIFLYSHLVRDFEEDSKTVMPFRKRYPKRRKIKGLFKYPLKCIDYVERATENFDNRYNISGRYLAKIKSQEVVEATNAPLYTPEIEKEEEKEEGKAKKLDLIRIWYFLNILCVLFFGFFHQGGIYGLTKNFHYKLLVRPRYTTYHLVTSHVYSLPLHLVAVKKNYKYKNTYFLHYEMGSEDLEKISKKLNVILKVSEAMKKDRKRNYKLFYAFPATLLDEVRIKLRNFTYEIEGFHHPHFSSEALPKFKLDTSKGGIVKFSGVLSLLNYFDCVPLRYFLEFFKQFRLVLIEIKLPEKSQKMPEKKI